MGTLFWEGPPFRLYSMCIAPTLRKKFLRTRGRRMKGYMDSYLGQLLVNNEMGK